MIVLKRPDCGAAINRKDLKSPHVITPRLAMVVVSGQDAEWVKPERSWMTSIISDSLNFSDRIKWLLWMAINDRN